MIWNNIRFVSWYPFLVLEGIAPVNGTAFWCTETARQQNASSQSSISSNFVQYHGSCKYSQYMHELVSVSAIQVFLLTWVLHVLVENTCRPSSPGESLRCAPAGVEVIQCGGLVTVTDPPIKRSERWRITYRLQGRPYIRQRSNQYNCHTRDNCLWHSYNT